MAELNGTGVAAVFAANTDHQIRPRLTAFFHRNPHQTAHALAVEHGKGVVLQDMLVNIGREELALGIVTAEPEACLREVVGPKAEELRRLRDFPGQQGRARQFDHAPAQVGEGNAVQLHALPGDPVAPPLQDLHLRLADGQRNLDFRQHGVPVPRQAGRRVEDGVHLHLVDFGIGDPKAAAAMPHHGVGLVQLDHLREKALLLFQKLRIVLAYPKLGRLDQQLFQARQEFMQRRVQQPDAHGQIVHCLEDAVKIVLLHDPERQERTHALLGGRRQNHPLDVGKPFLRHKHVLGTGQADALRTELAGLFRVFRRVRVGPDL